MMRRVIVSTNYGPLFPLTILQLCHQQENTFPLLYLLVLEFFLLPGGSLVI